MQSYGALQHQIAIPHTKHSKRKVMKLYIISNGQLTGYNAITLTLKMHLLGRINHGVFGDLLD